MLKFKFKLRYLLLKMDLDASALVEVTLLKLIYDVCHRFILVLQRFIAQFQLLHECLEVQSIDICGIFALTNTHQLLDFIHFALQLVVLSVQEVYLPRLTLHLLFFKLTTNFHIRKTICSCRSDLESLNFLITHLDLFFEKLYFLLHLIEHG